MCKKLELFLGALIAGLGCLHGYLFLSGYRLTADDVVFHYYLMGGISKAWQFIQDIAISQGRIVHFIDLPFSLLGSYYADSKIFRIFYTLLYFANFALIGKYVSMLAGVSSGFFIALVLISLHPLDYFHLAPNAYPFHISLPLMLIMISRMALWHIREVRKSHSNLVQALWLSACFIGMMFSEYGFVFAVALICAEFLTRMITRGQEKRGYASAFLYWFGHPYVLKDLALIFFFIISYMGFRFSFPSSYAGNQITGDFQLSAFLKTLFGHIYGGTSLAAFFRSKPYIGIIPDGLGYGKWMLCILVFIGTLVASLLALSALKKDDHSRKRSSRYWGVAAIALFCAIFVTAPVAITAKYQNWCVDINACVFVDSRISYLGVGVFVSALMLGIVAHQRSGFLSDSGIPLIVISAVLSIFATFTFLNNLRVESEMRNYVSGWDRASRLACASNEKLREIDSFLPRIIEPVPRISYHPGFDIKTYWLTYINHRRKHVHCNGGPMQVSELVPTIKVGERMCSNQTGAGVAYLASGWSSPETWGTWSDGETAEIIFPVSGKVHSILLEANALVTPAHPRQDVVVNINDVLVSRASLTSSSANLIEIVIPETLQEKIVDLDWMRVQLQLPDAVRPKEIGINEDDRKLSLGLQAITVR